MTETEKNSIKTGGRVKGTPNKNTQALLDMAEDMGVDPFKILLHFAGGDFEALGYEEFQTKSAGMGETYLELTIPPAERMKAAEKACAYLFPKRKSVEFQGGADDAQIEIKITRFDMAKHGPKRPDEKAEDKKDE